MKTISKLIFALLLTWNSATAQDTLYIYQNGSVAIKTAINDVDSITFYKSNSSTQNNTITDIDGNIYHTVKIGKQVWMVENLKVTHYRNGDAISNVTNDATWSGLNSGAYCWYNNDETTYKSIYSALYNWYALNDSRTLCPVGWHVPTDAEWTTLMNYLGDAGNADIKLKEMGTSHWIDHNNATNESGFTALPGGWRDNQGSYYFIGSEGIWWSSTESQLTKSYARSIDQLMSGVGRNIISKNGGLSVRCIKD